MASSETSLTPTLVFAGHPRVRGSHPASHYRMSSSFTGSSCVHHKGGPSCSQPGWRHSRGEMTDLWCPFYWDVLNTVRATTGEQVGITNVDLRVGERPREASLPIQLGVPEPAPPQVLQGAFKPLAGDWELVLDEAAPATFAITHRRELPWTATRPHSHEGTCWPGPWALLNLLARVSRLSMRWGCHLAAGAPVVVGPDSGKREKGIRLRGDSRGPRVPPWRPWSWPACVEGFVECPPECAPPWLLTLCFRKLIDRLDVFLCDIQAHFFVELICTDSLVTWLVGWSVS